MDGFTEGNLEVLLSEKGSMVNGDTKKIIVSSLERFIAACDDGLRNLEPTAVEDSIYDACKEYLRELHPESFALSTGVQMLEGGYETGVDSLLGVYPVYAINVANTVKDRTLMNFKERMPLGSTRVCVTTREKGISVRVVWREGRLVKAQAADGRLLTIVAQSVLGEFCDAFEGLSLVEMRGELLLPYSNLEEAVEYSPRAGSPRGGAYVLSFEVEDSVAFELLHFVFHDIMTDENDLDGLTTSSSKLEYIRDIGFEVPLFFVYDLNHENFEESVKDIVYQMDVRASNYDYYTDGVIITVDNITICGTLGASETYKFGSIVMKSGRWRQEGYSSVIERVYWEAGSTKKYPVAEIRPTTTASGVGVRFVPLYAPCNVLLLDAYPGNVLHFKFAGDYGVLPTFPDGRLILAPEIEDMLRYNYKYG